LELTLCKYKEVSQIAKRLLGGATGKGIKHKWEVVLAEQLPISSGKNRSFYRMPSYGYYNRFLS
jgi:hypothetical protein